MFCTPAGRAYPSGTCKAGYYCSGGSYKDEPAIDDSFGGPCVSGQFCPAGVHEPQSCTPGMCCDEGLLAKPNHNCSIGFYCTGGSKTCEPNGTDGTGICFLLFNVYAFGRLKSNELQTIFQDTIVFVFPFSGS